MGALLLALAAAAGAGGLWWYQARSLRLGGRSLAELPAAFDEDAEVALHVAQHEAVTRGHALSTVHIVYGLVQNERVIEALTELGIEPDAFETAILDTLATPRPISTGVTERVRMLYAYAFHSAGHAGRKPNIVDLWAYLRDSDADAVLDAAKVSHVDVLFHFIHGTTAPTFDALPDLGDVHVVLRNDDYTTRDFVVEILTGTFGLSEDVAEARMMQTHTEGRGVIARFRAHEAKSKIKAARELARTRGFPLWIGIEPI
jgi:ATP-dependent Clp protease adaptor protein ClpS